MYFSTDKWRTLTVGMMTHDSHFGDNQFTTAWHTLMAASTLMLIPIMVLYLCGSRFLVEGIKTSGLKG